MLNKLLTIITVPKIAFDRLIVLGNLTIIFTLSLLPICLPATALLRQHHETPNVLRYHAQDSLKDQNGNTWQVLLFPDNSQSVKTRYYLRLVGFPGINSFIHPKSLEILTSQGKIFTAIDAYAQFAPAPNVGQYDLTSVIPRLAFKGSWQLAVPLNDHRELALQISQSVLEEWRLLTQEIESKPTEAQNKIK
ncbi:MAG: DUF3122 domain-containing protein [Pleurocapsa sp.]